MTITEQLSFEGNYKNKKIENIYYYKNRNGISLYAKIRFENKEFTQCCTLSNGDFASWKLPEQRILYNFSEFENAYDVFLVEGEKDVETLRNLGIVATSMKDWKEEFTDLFYEKNVYICPDNDKVGYELADKVGKSLGNIPIEVRYIHLYKHFDNLPEHADISDVNIDRDCISLLCEEAEVTLQNPFIFGELIPINEVATPSFPVELLPSSLLEFISTVSEFTETDPAMCGILVLGALAGIFGGFYEILAPDGHSEQLSIYAVAIAQPAERKSAIIKIVTEAFRLYEKDFNKAHSSEIINNKTEKKKLEKALNTAEKELTEDNYQDFLSAQTAYDNFKEIYPLSLLTDDITPEKLAEKLSKQGERTLITSAEGGFFKRVKGRYSTGGDDTELYLKGHNGDPHTVERISRESIRLQSPTLSFCLTVQNSIIESFIRDNDLIGNGLTSRFLYVYCERRAGYNRKAVRSNDNSYYYSVFEKWNKTVYKMLNNTLNKSECKKLILSEEAREITIRYFYKCEERIRDGSDSEKNWNGKSYGAFLRIAGLLHCFECLERGQEPSEEAVSDVQILQAAKIMDCLAIHAQKVFLGVDKELTECEFILRHIRKIRRYEFPKQLLYQNTKKHFSEKNDFENALLILEESGYIFVANEKFDGSRQKSKIIKVNPKIL